MTKTPGASVETEETGDDAILTRAHDFYEKAQDWWSDTYKEGAEDVRFGRLGLQWHSVDEKQRLADCRPCETFNKMPSFIRQVVNDARQNKPAIKVHPADDKADPATAKIIDGLIRNIEVISNAAAAYDTGVEHSCDRGIGFWIVNTRYTCDDNFEQDLIIERVVNPHSVFGDYRTKAVDSSDWNEALIVDQLSKDEFKREYPKAEKVNWDFDFKDAPDWLDGDSVTVGQYWHREKVESEIVYVVDGLGGSMIVKVDDLKARPEDYEGWKVQGEPRTVESYKVTQYILSGAEVLKKTDWPGRYIPIIPVYGEEIVDDKGKRVFRAMIHGAKGAQRMYNYMRNTGIETVGLAPKAPWIGPKGAFDSDPNWLTANRRTHAYLEFDGNTPPQRTPYTGVPQGVIQEILSADHDMKDIIGLQNASLGIKSNETSGKAIRERKLEGDTATFHFGDNQNRAIRHTGLVLIDLIPKVLGTRQMARVLGEDMKARTVPLGQPVEEQDEQGNPITRVYDLTLGKYDLTVSSGPAFTSRREEANDVMTSVVQAYPDSAPILAPRIMKNLDIPDADEISREFDSLNPAKQAMNQIPPQVQQMIQEGQQVIQQQNQQVQQLHGENQSLKMDMAGKQADRELKQMELQVKAAEIEVKRMEAQAKLIVAQQPPVYHEPSRGSASQ
jgi:hypothetical protein